MKIAENIEQLIINACKEDPKEPTDDELTKIENELNSFEITEEEYEESFGSMPDLDKGLYGAKHRERLSTVRKVYNS